MTIQELENKHAEIIGESDLNYPDWLTEDHDTFGLYEKEEELTAKEATKLSIEFAIEVLEGLNSTDLILNTNLSKEICIKIQELKKYLDGGTTV